MSGSEAPVVAIDGPSASGKGTVSRRVASALATPWATVPLPDADGPSMAMTGGLFAASGSRLIFLLIFP